MGVFVVLVLVLVVLGVVFSLSSSSGKLEIMYPPLFLRARNGLLKWSALWFLVVLVVLVVVLVVLGVVLVIVEVVASHYCY